MDESYMVILYIAFALYTLLLGIAAVFDTWKFIIPNAIVVALVVLFIATALLLPFEMTWMEWLSHVGAAAAVFIGGAVLYAFNKMGGGDIKLLTAVAFWAGFEHVTELLLYVAVAGGVLAIGLIVLRRLIVSLGSAITRLAEVELPRVLLSGEAVPYGLAIAPISIYLGTKLPQLGANIWI
jgi:prepilin peptidase CpaA